ncbi:chitinase [Histoplasma capsulatum]|uniref:chitinase n=1 Tax=Ajellomyces capsulatus TaxID=5037 RepID=A0A8A1MLP1_AJECA|nr:hypothetical protein HCAG_02650 [Histoplasma mississippiense (nom. inval.)]EDN06047.1 hypothetical protein HCAG_02650 [Histoplasma mississippiense (nom. inval.)]QSS65584.1 chitinase [Histoplasma capsulatum]
MAGNYIMYLTGQHPHPPSDSSLINPITHVALAFMNSALFNKVLTDPPTTKPEWEKKLFTTVDKVRKQFAPGTKVMIAIGGWGDTKGFSDAARTVEGRKNWAANVAAMVKEMGADGIDVDWEYPGGNGADYKQIPNSEKKWEIDAYPCLLAELRSALGSDKTISAAVPGLPRDMLAFTPETLPSILESVDFFNIMTYDLMNLRDTVTKHHTGLALSLESIDAYMAAGLPPSRANLGFAFYVKWFRTEDPTKGSGCDKNPIGCKTVLLEDPNTGESTGQAGAFSWNEPAPGEVASSFERALAGGRYDDYVPIHYGGVGEGGGHYFWDKKENIWWTWDTGEAIKKKMQPIMVARGLGGAFAWGLGEDGPRFTHLQALEEGLKEIGIVK